MNDKIKIKTKKTNQNKNKNKTNLIAAMNKLFVEFAFPPLKVDLTVSGQ